MKGELCYICHLRGPFLRKGRNSLKTWKEQWMRSKGRWTKKKKSKSNYNSVSRARANALTKNSLSSSVIMVDSELTLGYSRNQENVILCAHMSRTVCDF